MATVKTQQELLAENESLKSKIASLQKSNIKLKEYAELIEESEQQFKAFANQTSEGITVADLEGNYVYVNSAFCIMSGYSEEELLEMTVFDMKAKNQSHQSFYKSKENMEGVAIPVNLQRKDGSEYLTEIVGNNIVIGKDKLILGTIRDVTAQKLASEQLLESENRYRVILENLNTGIVIHNNNEILYVNDSIIDMLDYTNEPSVIGKNLLDFVHPEDHIKIRDEIKKSLSASSKTNEMTIEVRLIKKDGSLILVKDTGLPINYNSKNARLVMIENITDRKLAEEKLQASEKRYRSIFESTPIALWEEDFSEVKVLLDNLKKKGVKHFKKYFDEHPEFVQECANKAIVIDVNKEAILLQEASSKEDLLNNITEFFIPESFEAFKKQLVSLATGKNQYELETVVKTKSENIKQVSLKFVVAPGYENDFKKVYISIQDISGLKKTQLDLLKHKNKLDEALRIANLGSFVFDDNTDLFESSTIADKILGIDKLYKRDIEGWTNLIHPEDFERVYQFVDNIGIENGAIEFRIVRPNDKKTIWLFANIKKEYDEKGVRSKLTGTFSDFTEHKEVIKALTDSENLLIESQQVAKIGSYVLNFDTGLWKNSLELDMIFGIKTEIRKGTVSWLNVIHPDDKEMMGEYLETNIMLNHEFFNKEYRVINAKTKKTIWVHGMGALEFNDKGDLLLMKGTIQDITDRKTINDAFKKSSKLLENLSAQIPGAIYQFLLRPDGTSCFPYASTGIKNIYGVTPEQIKESAEPAFVVIHPEDLERVGEGIQKSSDNLSIWRDEYRVILPGNKEPFWVEGHSMPQRLEDGSTLWHGLITNINERVKADKKINFLSEITQQSKNAILTTNLDFEITWVNESFKNIYGYTLEEVLGKTPDILSADFLAKEILSEIYSKVSVGNKFKAEGIDKKKDGTVFPVEFEVYPILDDGGNIFAYSDHITDITERKNKEEQLLASRKEAQENETRFKALHNASFGGIAIHNKGLILDSNKGLSEITGYSLDELIGMDGLLLIKESLREASMNKILSHYDKPYESVGIRKNKELYPIRLVGKTIPYKGKKVRSIEFRDISEQKKTEAELKNYRENLEELVSNRTKELETKNNELDNAMKVFVGREMKIRELNKKIQRLEDRTKLLEP